MMSPAAGWPPRRCSKRDAGGSPIWPGPNRSSVPRTGWWVAARNCTRQGLNLPAARVVRAEHYEDPACGAQAMEKLLALPQRPDAVFCFNDLLAWGAYETIVKHGLRVPEDIALIGYDDESFSSKTTVPLASIHLDTERLGRDAATMLLRKIEQPDERPGPQAVRITPQLVWRASLSPAPLPTPNKRKNSSV